MRRFLLSALVGAGLTAVAVIVCEPGHWNAATSVLLWPWVLLVHALPHPNIGTPAHPFYEGTPLDLLAFPVGLALSWLFYSALAYAIAAWQRRRADHRA